MDEKHTFTNRLIREKSPYLLQHAHNPVDWFPWGEEAFQAAKNWDKPIFLSIGYATCHWCHTMEAESFESPEVAELMNEAFINIKVDREELPEVDALYMDFAQSMMAGSAGWPLNLILTPALEPFFAATYLPPHNSRGMMGLVELIGRIRDVWRGEEREKVEMQASRIVEAFSENIHSRGDALPAKTSIGESLELLFKIADPVYGGLRGAPKFPVGYQCNFLLNYSHTFQDSRALFLAERTLDMMHRGGIYDHVGGGFSRYSVDERWMIPHFEKMLYDNALLAGAYVDAFRFTQNSLYREIASETLDYILRDMTHPEGGFYSAEDADSEGHEGRFYTWLYPEVEKILGEDFKVFAEYYGLTPQGNFEGRNVLHTTLRLDEFAAKYKVNKENLDEKLKKGRRQLFEVRERRVHPFKDDKILTAWNGLMIHSLAEAGAAFQESFYTIAAKKSVNFIRTYLWNRENLFRRWRDGEVLHRAGLDDYAFLIRGLLTLFEKGEGTEYFEFALQLTERVEELFKEEGGAFFQSDGQDSSLILRKCSFPDGAEPSGNAVHGENLLRLYQITGDKKYLEQSEDILRAAKKYLDNYSPGYFFHIMNLNRYYDASKPTLVIALDEKLSHKDSLVKSINQHTIPHGAVVWIHPRERLKDLCYALQTYEAKEGKTTLYICYEGRCQPPLTDIHLMLEAIQKLT